MVSSLSTSVPSAVRTPQWPWSVYSSRHEVAHHDGVVAELACGGRRSPAGRCRRVPGLGPFGVLVRRHAEQHERADAGLGGARPPPCAVTRACAGTGPAWRRSRPARRSLPSRTAARSDRRRRARSLGSALGARASAGAAGDAGRGSSCLSVPGSGRSGARGPARGEDALERGDHAVDRVGPRDGGHDQPVGPRLLRRHRADAHDLGVALHRLRAPRRTPARSRRW